MPEIVPADLQQLLQELSLLRTAHDETRAQLANVLLARQSAHDQRQAPEPNAPLPERYNGNASTLQPFLTTVQLTFVLQPSRFVCDATKVAYVGALLTGTALGWFSVLAMNEDSCLHDYSAFTTMLTNAFGNANEQVENDYALRNLRQGSRTVSEYLADFRRLSTGSGYDSYARASFLRAGLSEELKDRLSMQPVPTCLQELESLVLRLDQLVIERRRERNEDSRRFPRTAYNRYIPSQTYIEPAKDTSAVTDCNTPIPMELDNVRKGPLPPSERQRRMRNGLCLYCGESNHMVRNCSKRNMSNDAFIASKDANKVNISACYVPALVGNAVCKDSTAFVFPVNLHIHDKCITAHALVDSGASHCFISSSFVNEHGITTMKLSRPQPLRLIDGQSSSSGDVTHQTSELGLTLNGNYELINLLITTIPSYDIVLGLSWLRLRNPSIDWVRNTISFDHNDSHSVPEVTKSETDIDYYQQQTHALEVHACYTVPKSEVIPPLMTMPVTHLQVPRKYADMADVFSKVKADILPEHRRYDCDIPLIDNTITPPFKKVYRLSEPELAAMKSYVQENLSKGFIRPSSPPSGAPAFFVKKKDGSLRPCIDYRGLNALTVRNRHPLPLISEILDHLRGATVFTKIDLRGAYNLVRIKKDDEWKTAFRTHAGHFEYLVMPFGLTNAPAIFQSMMTDIFRDYLDIFVAIYLDDLLIFSKTMDEHEQHVRRVLARLRDNRLYAKLEKCEFDCASVEFLGVIVSAAGTCVSPQKILSVNEWPQPASTVQLQRFLGLANFCRDFIKEYSAIVQPLTDLTSKKIEYKWTPITETAFQTIKKALASSPILRHADPSLPFLVEPDASDWAEGAVLMQRHDDGHLHPVAYHSRKFSPAERNYPVHDKELLAIVNAFKVWRHYLAGATHKITVLSDHRNLAFFRHKQALSQRHARWSQLLADYDFVIEYRPGEDNVRADALSRRPDYEPTTADAIEPVPLLSPTNFRIAAADICPPGCKHVTSQHEKLSILRQRHDAPTAGHYGQAKTYELVVRDFWWPGMRAFINDYVKTCDLCQRSKMPRHRPHGLLLPLPVPLRPWSSVSMDFIVKLPKSNGFDSILVFVCRLSKMAHFVPCTEQCNAKDVAGMFIQYIFRLHGLPDNVVSDRGPQFRSLFWRSLLSELGTKTNLSSSHHPQSDGQTERVNQVLEQYLRCFVDHQQSNWSKLLPLAEFSHNNARHSSTLMSPFYAVTGIHPRADMLESSLTSTSNVPSVTERLNNLKKIHTELKSNMAQAQETFKKFADKTRQEHKFTVGEKVWLLRRHQRTNRPCDKLDFKRLGPFSIIEQINHVAFRLALPPYITIHNVFHTSMLEKYHASTIAGRTVTPPPPDIVDDQLEFSVESILDSRVHRGKLQYLVSWQGYTPDDNIWINIDELSNCKEAVRDFHIRCPHRPTSSNTRSRQTTRDRRGV